jgi:hypothetical protein
MEQQQARQVEQQLRQDWQQIRYRILDQFAQVSTADLDSARNVNDLVQRIADKSHHSERYVETRLLELVGAAAGQGGQGVSTGPQLRPGSRSARRRASRSSRASRSGRPGSSTVQSVVRLG